MGEGGLIEMEKKIEDMCVRSERKEHYYFYRMEMVKMMIVKNGISNNIISSDLLGSSYIVPIDELLDIEIIIKRRILPKEFQVERGK